MDPAGHVLGYKGTAAGAKEQVCSPWVGESTRPTAARTPRPSPQRAPQEAINALEKKYKVGVPATAADTVQLAISTMQGVLSSDFKASEIEVAVVRAGGAGSVQLAGVAPPPPCHAAAARDGPALPRAARGGGRGSPGCHLREGLGRPGDGVATARARGDRSLVTSLVGHCSDNGLAATVEMITESLLSGPQ